MFVIRQKHTGFYITSKKCMPSNSIEDAKVFTQKGCGGMLKQSRRNKDDYEILEVEIKLKNTI